MKKCSKCAKTKSLEYFNFQKASKGGHYPYCKECTKEQNKKYRTANKEKCNQYNLLYYQKNKEYLCKRQSEYNQKNKVKNNEYKKKYIFKKRRKDLNYNIKLLLRSRIHHALKGLSKVSSSSLAIGCSLEFLKSYIEDKFQPGMTWENWSLHGWHLDHIIPLSAFDLSDKNQFFKAFNYTNLQPLWAKENLKKSNKVLTNML